jgi:putative ABC transport system ATP-binding protein
LLRRSARELEQTVIVVTHDPKAAAYASRVVFLRDGNIVTTFEPPATMSLAQRLRGIMNTMEQLEA